MTRCTYHLTDQQIQDLKDESKRTGLSVAELIRRAVDAARPGYGRAKRPAPPRGRR
ncbi:MAG: ribbon-helix-helix domain-containing protein [Acidobacteriaceae bacterium]|nr:ribbon-helix-helix domain-containing protein [Acidobacteriaceae bacterium]